MIIVPVDLGERSYEVHVGAGVRHKLAEVLPDRARRVAIVTQREIGIEISSGREQTVFVMPNGESAKSMATVDDLCRQVAGAGLTRDDVVVGLGGGVVTDVAGFVASIYLRGISVVHVPTTLLAQVDAAVGGKTGVNLPEGKNLVGTFWQPTAVLCDTEVLDALPVRELRSGWGELAKYHFLTGTDLAALDLEGRIAECVRFKAAIVSQDEREGAGRALLNYGHTLAHALETAGEYDLRHGEAVGIGLVYAARLARRLGRIDSFRVHEHVRVVEGYGLPTMLPPGANPTRLLDLMARDKKARRGLTFVLDGPNGPELVVVEPSQVMTTMEDMRAP